MPSVPPPPEQFWLLTGEVPAGPFTVAQVHAELAAGRATWQTPACPVGGSTWLPLVRTPGVGPTAPLPGPGAGPQSPQPPSPPSPLVSAAPTDEPAAASAAEPSNARTPVAPSEPLPAAASPPMPSATASPGSTVAAGWNSGPQTDAGRLSPSAEPNRAGPPTAESPDGRFWVMVGTETIGPLRAGEIRGRLRDGRLPPDAVARRIGTDSYLPIEEAVGPLPPRSPTKPKAPPAGGTAATPSVPAAADTPVEVRCGCGRLVHAEKAFAGQNVRCPHCNGSVAVPAGTAAAVPEPRPTTSEPWLDSQTRQAIHGIVGIVLVVAVFGFFRGCKEDQAKERENRPPLRDTIKK